MDDTSVRLRCHYYPHRFLDEPKQALTIPFLPSQYRHVTDQRSYNYLTPHVYISLCVLSWGLLASLQSLTTSFTQMLILRLLLGLSEAAFSPGVPYYLSFFYRREELAFRCGLQVSAAPLAASFAGSLAWVITRLGQNGPLAPWRLLFLVEGFPSVIVAVVAWRAVAGMYQATQEALQAIQQRADAASV